MWPDSLAEGRASSHPDGLLPLDPAPSSFPSPGFPPEGLGPLMRLTPGLEPSASRPLTPNLEAFTPDGVTSQGLGS